VLDLAQDPGEPVPLVKVAIDTKLVGDLPRRCSRDEFHRMRHRLPFVRSASLSHFGLPSVFGNMPSRCVLVNESGSAIVDRGCRSESLRSRTPFTPHGTPEISSVCHTVAQNCHPAVPSAAPNQDFA
jgi:hypothetical protein